MSSMDRESGLPRSSADPCNPPWPMILRLHLPLFRDAVSMDAVKHAVFPQVAGRMPSIDAARAIAIFAVLAIHCDPSSGGCIHSESGFRRELIDLAGRFAVPSFVVSGYLLGERCRKSGRDLRVVSGFAGRLAEACPLLVRVLPALDPDWNAAWEGGWIRLAYWRCGAVWRRLESARRAACAFMVPARAADRNPACVCGHAREAARPLPRLFRLAVCDGARRRSICRPPVAGASFSGCAGGAHVLRR